jgi:hypothetical protein
MRRWICAPGTPSAHKKCMTERCSSVVQFISFAAIFTTVWQLSYWTARSAGLPDWLVTWHSQIRPITIPTALTSSSENIKVRKLFESSLVQQTACVLWDMGLFTVAATKSHINNVYLSSAYGFLIFSFPHLSDTNIQSLYHFVASIQGSCLQLWSLHCLDNATVMRHGSSVR